MSWNFQKGVKFIMYFMFCINKAISHKIVISDTLPPLDDQGQLTLIPEKVLKISERRLRSRTIKEYLVQWKDIPSEDATWEEDNILQHTNLKFLEDKKYWVGRTVMSPFK